MAREAQQLNPGDREGEVIPLGKEPPPAPVERGTRPRGLHGTAIAATAVFFIFAILSGIAFITVRWPGDSGRVVTALFMFSVIGVAASVSAAVLTAARVTHVTYREPEPEEGSPTPSPAAGNAQNE
jgi:hypothetical protein